MQLLGSRNWWIPGWLERILPELDVERGRVAGAEARP
jgi:putative drug exporter of the RND superfamily